MGMHIQFIGLVGSGKSHLARELAAMVNGYVVPFAQGVYKLAELARGAPIDKSIPEDRELLKLVGTTWGRESKELPNGLHEKLEAQKPEEWGSPDIWAKIFVASCRQLPPGASIFNDDTRFENEIRIAGEQLGFMPVYVKCRESTRLQRLRKRGESYDPNDPKHKSEALSNAIDGAVLERYILPVVWNDDAPAPHPSWVTPLERFRGLVQIAESNVALSAELAWTPRRLVAFLKFASETTYTTAD